MDIFIYPLVDNQNVLMVRDTLQAFSSFCSYQDFILIPFVLFASTFIYNRGSLLPRRDPYAYKLFERPQCRIGSQASKSLGTRNIAEKIEANNADLVIFWGSQSGVAEGFAQRLACKFTRRFKKTALVADLSDFDPQTLTLIPRTKPTVFILSTYGEGDPSDNALEFVAWVTSEADGSLGDLQYAAFGCGNRNYRHYNKTVDDTVIGLSSRGAKAIMPTGKGDESNRTTEEDFLEWESKFYSVLVSQFGLVEYEVGYEPEIEIIEDNLEVPTQFPIHDPFHKGSTLKQRASEIVAVPVATQRAIATYKDPERTCVHLELEFAAHREIKYKTGDHISIWPVNPTEEISSLLRMLELELRKDTWFRIQPRGNSYYELKVPSPTTPYALFSHHLEICAPVPRRSVLLLAEFAPTARAKTELKALAQTKDAYAQFLKYNHVTLSRLLEYATRIDPSVTWAGLPLSFVIDILPAMKPRTYSISSSPAVSPRRVSITVSTNPTRLEAEPDITIPGLASTFLSSHLPPWTTGADRNKDLSLEAPWVIHAQVRTSTFRLPVSLSVPIVMVAAGTGIAPFRAFIQERAHLVSVGREIGPMLLFFGCQDESDFLYRDMITDTISSTLAGKLQVFTAFSRAEGTKKQYVGDKLTAYGPEVGRLLTKEDGALYICGAAAMATSVKDIIRKEVRLLQGWSDAEADDWLQERKARRWFEDVWG
ncbi:hypothetical protein GGR51DRAFT_575128 [Nemania sp. FL0031]|nr:hypothetical protein GGR51DRAFT_575128 [Nemania sp. FL0031]